jgi:O-antigen/teichoic acid export membrane protein
VSLKRFITGALLYGVADMIALAVGGFLLLPIYTRLLSQEEFGAYVVIKANIELFAFMLYMGLPSAFSRVYFDYDNPRKRMEYLNSILFFYLLTTLFFGAIVFFFGSRIWKLMSPETSVYPYLYYAFAISGISFFGAMSTTWLRNEGRVLAFCAIQVFAALSIAISALFCLITLQLGLSGLLISLLIGAIIPAAFLPFIIKSHFILNIKWEYISKTMKYAIPMMIGYIAYFGINRINIFILQRYSELREIAIFGLAQQLAMIVSIASVAFGKVFQPKIYSTHESSLLNLAKNAGDLLIILMCALAGLLILFSPEIFYFAAPKKYGDGYIIFIALVIGNYVYSCSLISDSIILYHRLPNLSLLVTAAGSIFSIISSIILVPILGVNGAALSILGAFIFGTSISHFISFKILRVSHLKSMLSALSVLLTLSLIAIFFENFSISINFVILSKIFIVFFISIILYSLFLRNKLKDVHASLHT